MGKLGFDELYISDDRQSLPLVRVPMFWLTTRKKRRNCKTMATKHKY